VRIVIARCSVDYAGRLTASLASALRLLIVKADGSVLVHSDGGPIKSPKALALTLEAAAAGPCLAA
jgi:RecB family endonuclease NucS